MDYEKMSTPELMTELRGIASLAFPGPVARQNTEKIVTILRQRKKEGK